MLTRLNISKFLFLFIGRHKACSEKYFYIKKNIKVFLINVSHSTGYNTNYTLVISLLVFVKYIL